MKQSISVPMRMPPVELVKMQVLDALTAENGQALAELGDLVTRQIVHGQATHRLVCQGDRHGVNS